jgi:hypothetical protein
MIRASTSLRIPTENNGSGFFRSSVRLKAFLLSSVGAGVRANQVADHSLITGLTPVRFPLEKCQRVVIDRERDFRLLANFAGQCVRRRKIVFDPHPVAR